MARPSRAEVFDTDEVAIAHVFNRTVRRCFLMGDDALLFVTTFWTLCSSSRRWRAFGKNWVTNFAISAAVLCYGTAAVPVGPRLMVIWADSVRPPLFRCCGLVGISRRVALLA